MNVIEMIVAVIQAYIFTMLVSTYIGAAVEEHHH
jgi:F-type H+-transporting ATPase subunit a